MGIAAIVSALFAFAIRGMVKEAVKERERRQKQLEQFDSLSQEEKDRLAKMMLQQIIRRGR